MHKCNVCDFSSPRRADLDRHKTTKKHIANLEKALSEFKKNVTCKNNDELILSDTSTDSDLEEESKPELFSCKYCSKTFSHAPSKCRHEKQYCKKKKTNNIETSEIPPEKNGEVAELKQQVKSLMELVVSTVGIMKDNTQLANKSVSTTSYVVKHFNKAPPIKRLENKKAMKLLEYNVPKNHTSGDVIIFSYKSGILDKYLGNIIVDEYKTANPEDQSFWNSDSVRLSFIVREVLKSGDDEWIADKSGLKLTNLIISPMLEGVKDVMKKYVKLQGELIEGGDESSEITLNMTAANEIIVSINKNNLHAEILKFIAPHFNLIIGKKH